jgi:TRAP-type C4-dicarboxylate transport system permease small subunit
MRRARRAQHIGRTPARSLTPLLVQAGAGSSLASIMAFVSAGLLLLGSWVLVEIFDHPLQAQPTEMIGAAVMITLASIMLVHLLSPRGTPGSGRHRHKTAAKHRPHAARLAPIIDVPAKTQEEAIPFATRFADPHVTGD